MSNYPLPPCRLRSGERDRGWVMIGKQGHSGSSRQSCRQGLAPPPAWTSSMTTSHHPQKRMTAFLSHQSGLKTAPLQCMPNPKCRSHPATLEQILQRPAPLSLHQHGWDSLRLHHHSQTNSAAARSVQKPSRPTHWQAGLEGGGHRARVVTMKRGSRKTPTSAQSHSRGINRRRVKPWVPHLDGLSRSQPYSAPRLERERMIHTLPEPSVQITVTMTKHASPGYSEHSWVRGPMTNALYPRRHTVEAEAFPKTIYRKQEHCRRRQERPRRKKTISVYGSPRRCTQPREHTPAEQHMHRHRPIKASLGPIRMG